MTKPLRMVLVLGKFRVSDVKQLPLGSDQEIKVQLGGSTTMTATLPGACDVREGDLLTFYTEVLMKGSDSALTISPPIQ